MTCKNNNGGNSNDCRLYPTHPVLANDSPLDQSDKIGEAFRIHKLETIKRIIRQLSIQQFLWSRDRRATNVSTYFLGNFRHQFGALNLRDFLSFNESQIPVCVTQKTIILKRKLS